jgi:hypothetical protein
MSSDMDSNNPLHSTAASRYCVVAFLSKSPSKTTAEFRDYYEHNHIPLVLRTVRAALPPGTPSPMLVYARRYLEDRQTPLVTASGEVASFDCITEVQFSSKEAFEKYWMAPLIQGDGASAIAEDEAQFLDRSKTMAYQFEQHQTVVEGGQVEGL